MKKIILASESVWKKRVLEDARVVFEVRPSTFEEDMAQDLSPEELAKDLALGKAREIATQEPDAIVIGTDCFVAFEGKVIGKPKIPERAKEILTSYIGKKVTVITGLAVIHKGVEKVTACVANIYFRTDLSEAEIDAYIQDGEPLECGGSFTHNHLGASLMEKEDGDYTTIIGLPLYQTLKYLREFGYNPLVKM
jgi:septum formation protein